MRHFLFLICVGGYFISQAQNHSWAQQFGANATLIGGAAVAGCRDNTSLYYNPGLMGFVDNARISVSANIYELSTVNLKNIAGVGLDARSTRVLFYPQFIGGSLVVKKMPKLKVYYGTLLRNRSSVRYNLLHEMRYDVIPGAPGDELYKARLEYDMNAIETWLGLGLGYRVNDMFSCGISLFGTYFNLENKTAIEINADALLVDTSSIIPYVATSNSRTTLRLDHVGFICKLGVGIDLKQLKLGLAVTLPSASIWGRGSLFRSIEGYNLNIYTTDTQAVFKYPAFLVSDEQRNRKVLYKTTPSFALGASYMWQNLKMDFSAEYFLGMEEYDVLRGMDQAPIRPVDAYGGKPVQNFLVVRTQAKPVFNVGLGLSYKIKNKLKILTGFRTDFNNRMNFLPTATSLSSFNPSHWHLLHFSVGASYNRGASDITFGINYSLGLAAERTQVVNFTEPQQSLWLRGAADKTLRTYVNNLGLVIGYTYFFRGNTRSSETNSQQQVDW